MPSAEPTANGFPVIQFLNGKIPAAIGLPNTTVETILEAERAGGHPAGDVFQREWLDACKGRSNNVVHGTSSKTHCDFDYAGSMIEQMLLGLVAHRAGKKLEYDPAAGRVTNSARSQRLSEAAVSPELDSQWLGCSVLYSILRRLPDVL